MFRIDLSAYYHYVYPRLLKLPFDDTAEDANTEGINSVVIRCLQLMLASKTYRMSARSAAFAKRLATVALHGAPAGCIGLMQLCRQIIGADPRLDQLVVCGASRARACRGSELTFARAGPRGSRHGRHFPARSGGPGPLQPLFHFAV